MKTPLKTMNKEICLNDVQVVKLLQLSGKLAKASRLVTTSNIKKLSQSIKEMEFALDAYDEEILFLSNENTH